MTDEVIGRVDPATLDFTPIVLTIAGYTNEGEEVLTQVAFKNEIPMGFTVDAIRSGVELSTLLGDKTGAQVVEFLYAATYDETAQATLDALIHSKVNVEYTTLGAVFKELAGRYTKRPTRQRSSSPGGGRSTKPTAGAAASKPVSRSRASA